MSVDVRATWSAAKRELSERTAVSFNRPSSPNHRQPVHNQLPQKIVWAVEDDEMVTAFESYECILGRLDRGEIFLGELDRGLLIVRPHEDEDWNVERRPFRQQVDGADRVEELCAGVFEGAHHDIEFARGDIGWQHGRARQDAVAGAGG